MHNKILLNKFTGIPVPTAELNQSFLKACKQQNFELAEQYIQYGAQVQPEYTLRFLLNDSEKLLNITQFIFKYISNEKKNEFINKNLKQFYGHLNVVKYFIQEQNFDISILFENSSELPKHIIEWCTTYNNAKNLNNLLVNDLNKKSETTQNTPKNKLKI